MDYSPFIEASEYCYKLSFLDSSSNKSYLTITSLAAKEFIYNEKVTYTVSMNGLQFHRKVYEPGIITMELFFTLKGEGKNDETIFTETELKDILVGRKVTLSVYPKEKESKAVVIAENYYVHEICPQVVNDSYKTKIFVKVDIFSMDHLMTLDKYSKAYTVKKLGSGILRAESKNFKLSDASDEDYVKVYTDNMKNLRYEEEDSVGGVPIKIPTEYIQPYLVQYNETFYEFLARTANRCGEFLFFEDGVLTLGMPKDGGDATNATMITDYRSVTYPKLSTSPLKVSLFARDSIKGGTYSNDLNDSEIEVDDVTKFADDTFAKNLSYNFELSHDEYIFTLYKDHFADLESAFGIKGASNATRKLLFDVFSKVVNNDDTDLLKCVINIPKDLLTQWSKEFALAAIAEYKQNSSGNKKWFESDTYKENPQQNNGSAVVPFATLKDQGSFTLINYSNIHKKEEEQRGKIVCIDMGTKYLPVKIGQMITIDKMGNTKYVVVEVKQSVACEEDSHTYLKYEDEGNAQLTGGEQSQLIFAIPVIHDDKKKIYTIVPPLRSEPYIRKSGPQTAFVVNNADPKSQGRVRIAYPWQMVEKKGDATYRNTLKDNLKMKEQDFLLASTKMHFCLGQCLLQKKLTEELEKIQNQYKNASEAEQKAAIESYKSKIIDKLMTENQNSIQTIEDALDIKKDNCLEKQITNKQAEIDKEKDEKKKAQLEEERDQLIATKRQYEQLLPDLKEYQSFLENLQKILDDYNQKGTETFDVFIQRKIDESKEKEQSLVKDLNEAITNNKTASLNYDIAKSDYDKTGGDWEAHLNEVASPWVRVTSPMATYEGGVQFKPNPGDEVLVNFDNGNVERPYVAGSLYSKEHIDPKEEMVIKSPSGQKISFKVAHDGWEPLQTMFPLLKTLQTWIPPAKKGLEGDGAKLAGDITMRDECGMFEVSMSSGKRAVNIKSPFGNVSIGAFTGINITAPHGDIKIKGKNVTIEAGNNLTLLSGTNVNDKEFKWKDYLLESSVNLGATFVPELKGGKIVDITLLRCLADVWLRPIEGTLCVKSKNYLKLEAGKGKAEVTQDRYTKNWQDKMGYRDNGDHQLFNAKVTAYVQRINLKITQFCREYDQLWKEAFQAQTAYETNLNKIWDGSKPKPEFKKIAFQLNDNPFVKFDPNNPDSSTFNYDNDITIDKLQNQLLPAIDVGGKTISNEAEARDYIKEVAEPYGEAISKLNKKANGFVRLFANLGKDVNQALFNKDTHDDSNWIDDCFTNAVINGAEGLTKFSNEWRNVYISNNDPTDAFLQQEEADDVFCKSLWMKRKMVIEFLMALQGHANNNNNKYLPFSDSAFQNRADEAAVNNLWNQVTTLNKTKTRFDKFTDVMSQTAEVLGIDKTWKPLIDPSAPYLGLNPHRDVWNDQSGKIIFSDTKFATYGFEKGEIKRWALAGIGDEEMLKNALSNIQ